MKQPEKLTNIGIGLLNRMLHQTKMPGGWNNVGTFCRFISEEFSRFASRLKATQEDILLSNLFVAMLQRLGAETDPFADNSGTIADV